MSVELFLVCVSVIGYLWLVWHEATELRRMAREYEQRERLATARYERNDVIGAEFMELLADEAATRCEDHRDLLRVLYITPALMFCAWLVLSIIFE